MRKQATGSVAATAVRDAPPEPGTKAKSTALPAVTWTPFGSVAPVTGVKTRVSGLTTPRTTSTSGASPRVPPLRSTVSSIAACHCGSAWMAVTVRPRM